MVKTYKKTDNAQLSRNFRLGEFKCKCSRCSRVLVDTELVEILQKIRDHFGVSVNINSGYRCKEHNAEVGGDPNSSHMQGMAADIVVKGVVPKEVAKYAESIGVKRIGLYDSFVHIGSGKTKRFWLGHEGTKVETFGATTPDTNTNELAYKIGDIVIFEGGNHYSSADASTGRPVKAGRAKVTSISENGSHPYHCRAIDGSGKFVSGVYGWVDENKLTKEKPWTPTVGDIVIYNGNKHYANANAVNGSTCKGGKAKITNIYQLGKSKHPYHLVRVSGKGSDVYGWVDEGSFTKA